MNIKDAKEEIRNAMVAYFSKNMYGEYEIPIEKQRPVFLMGPPGIGKTAIMEQVASELGVGLISYSMTHHTRQSAIGLPFIETKNYGGRDYDVSEYTMSEIIASVYDMMEETGIKEGILFLDEVNCVSETLAPAMLQFLQYKIFGRHRVPDGWIIVTAGNPPEFNNSVREFDIVTWDRLKRIDIDPDYEVWKEYAYKKNVHPAITTYLDIKKADFYKIETTVNGKSFVTARGWSDLSDMMRLYERNNIEIKERLIAQYIQNAKIAKEFAIYYDLFNKYRSDYQVDEILAGKATPEIKDRAMKAKFDERLSLLGILLDSTTATLKNINMEEEILREMMTILKGLRTVFAHTGCDYAGEIFKQIENLRKTLETGKKATSISLDKQEVLHAAIHALEEDRKNIMKASPDSADVAWSIIKKDYDSRTKKLAADVKDAKELMYNLFVFCEEVFNEGQEILILVTELTISYYGAHFISRYGCEKYFEHNKDLLFYERQKDIIRELELMEE